MPNNKPKSTRGGFRPGAGLKVAPEHKVQRSPTYCILERQYPRTNKRVREDIDLANAVVNAIGNPDFDADSVIQKLNVNPSGSDIAVCNLLAAAVGVAKEMYKK